MNENSEASSNNTNLHDSMSESMGASIAVIVSFHKKSPRIGISVCMPRKRDGFGDNIQYTLLHSSFLDDSRCFANLESFLNRFEKIDLIHLGCTEFTEAPPKCSDAVRKKTEDANRLFQKLQSSLPQNSNIIEHHNLPKSLISNPSQTLDKYMLHLLGNENSPQHLAYRGNRTLEECNLSKATMCFLIEELNLTNQAIEGSYEVKEGSLNSCLNLDGVASECINLFPPKNAGVASIVGGNKGNNSLFGVLNQTKTKMGARLLEVWLRQPLVDKEQIDERLDMVEMFVTHGCETKKLRNSGLKTVCDIDRLCEKVVKTKGGSSALELLYHMYILADQQLPAVIEQMDAFDSENSKFVGFLTGLQEACLSLEKLKELVEAVLDFDAAPRDFIVKSDFDDRLSELRVDLKNIDVELENMHDKMDYEWSEVSGKKRGLVKLENVSTDDAGCCWQYRLIDTNDEKILRSKMNDRVNIHRLLKNGVYFSTKELRELGTQKQDIMMEYNSKQKGIVKDAMDVALTYIPVLEKSSLILALLDVLASFAHVAINSPNPYNRPLITDSDDESAGIVIERARHPCVELQDGMTFIPNNFDLRKGSSSFMILTGPNMGGKSTYIRSLGAIVTLAQVGSFVPADSATINVVDKILARVGAGDAQQKGISTFMAEMLEASSILQRASKRSLIIIDELGRGTSTFDGFGLAWAISEYIVSKIGAITLFATHFHELTRLEKTQNCVKNFHVSADSANGELTFLYDVQPGPCLESFGIRVAQMANVPQIVIEEAKRKVKDLEDFESSKRSKSSEQDFIKQFKKIPLQNMLTREEKLSALKTLFQ